MKNDLPKKGTLARTEANRENAQHSTGPRDTSSTRLNAKKHGLLSEGMTELDHPESFNSLLTRLEAQWQPVGDLETFFVKRIALGMVRVNRAASLEAECLTAKLNPAITQTTRTTFDEMRERMDGIISVLDPGLPARLTADDVDTLTGTFQRYETAVENKLTRAIHELERLQRIRRGENIPAPASVDVAVHTDASALASFGNPPLPQGD